MRILQAIKAELHCFTEANPPEVHGVSWEVRRVLHRIHDAPFDGDLNVQALKAHCHIRDNNVSCRFKQEVGISMKDYIGTFRLQAASALLRCGGYSASEVAYAVGYRNPQTFYRAFMREFHCTPGEIRKRGDASCVQRVQTA